MPRLFKPTYTKVDPTTGERITHSLRKWYAEFRDADGVLRRVPLCEDKTAAQTMLLEKVRAVERQIAGIIDPSTEDLKRPVEDFVDDYQKHLASKARSERHIAETTRLIRRILHEARCRVLADLQSATDGLEKCLADRLASGVSHRTVNADLISIRSFCRWLLSRRRIQRDPTIGLEHLNTEKDRRHERRALTDEESQRLIRTNDRDVSEASGIYRGAIER